MEGIPKQSRLICHSVELTYTVCFKYQLNVCVRVRARLDYGQMMLSHCRNSPRGRRTLAPGSVTASPATDRHRRPRPPVRTTSSKLWKQQTHDTNCASTICSSLTPKQVRPGRGGPVPAAWRRPRGQ